MVGLAQSLAMRWRAVQLPDRAMAGGGQVLRVWLGKLEQVARNCVVECVAGN
jgi:hypothetical protein